MSRKQISRRLAELFAFLFYSLAGIGHLVAEPVDVPFRLYDHLIVVEGSVPGHSPLNLVIDTGATYSVISAELQERLELPTGETEAVSWGKKIPVRTGILEEVEIGERVFSDIDVRVGHLSLVREVRIDLLVGLDLLRRTNVTIDYENQILTLGATPPSAPSVGFYPNLPFLLIRFAIQEHNFPLILDTGSPELIFFEEDFEDRVEIQRTNSRRRLSHVAGQENLRKIFLPGASLGRDSLGTVSAYILKSSRALYGGAAGIFSPRSLQVKRLHLDFERNQIGWEL